MAVDPVDYWCISTGFTAAGVVEGITMSARVDVPLVRQASTHPVNLVPVTRVSRVSTVHLRPLRAPHVSVDSMPTQYPTQQAALVVLWVSTLRQSDKQRAHIVLQEHTKIKSDEQRAHHVLLDNIVLLVRRSVLLLSSFHLAYRPMVLSRQPVHAIGPSGTRQPC